MRVSTCNAFLQQGLFCELLAIKSSLFLKLVVSIYFT